MTTAGDVNTQAGMAAHVYLATQSMTARLLLQCRRRDADRAAAGRVRFFTEFGRIEAGPGEICIIPRGVKFKVELVDGPARGYVCENYGAKFTLPDRGPIGANCLANARDFKTPVAAFEDKEEPCRLTVKWCGGFHVADIGHSPLDVVAWHGNYAPYKIRPAALLAGRRHPVRPPRPVDLHGADRAVGDGRHRQHRFRRSSPSAGRWPSTRSARPGTT